MIHTAQKRTWTYPVQKKLHNLFTSCIWASYAPFQNLTKRNMLLRCNHILNHKIKLSLLWSLFLEKYKVFTENLDISFSLIFWSLFFFFNPVIHLDIADRNSIFSYYPNVSFLLFMLVWLKILSFSSSFFAFFYFCWRSNKGSKRVFVNRCASSLLVSTLYSCSSNLNCLMSW